MKHKQSRNYILQGQKPKKRWKSIKPPALPEGFKADFTIEFDGGTSCNIPSRGYGRGYGSFQINGEEIHRVEFGMGHSANSAEINTLASALKTLAMQEFDLENKVVLVRGDSQIALKWISHQGEPNVKHSQGFQDAIKLLREAVKPFKLVKSQWRSRNVSVQLFGH